MLLIAVVKIIVLFTVTSSKEIDTFTEICANVLSQVVEGKYAVCLLVNSGYFDRYIASCLNSINVPILTIFPENFTNCLNKRHVPTGCSAYLIFSNNYTHLQRLFDYEQGEKFQFEVHKKVLVIYSGTENFLTRPFNDVASTKGNDVIVIDSFDIDMDREDLLKKMRVTSLLQKEILPVWNFKRRKMSDIAEMLHVKGWEPNFRKGKRYFRIATFNCTPFIYTNVENQVYDGIDFHMIKLLLRGWPIMFVAYKTVPYMNMYNLVLQTVYHEINDLATCSIWQTAVLFNNLDYTHSYMESCSSFLVPTPHQATTALFVYYPINLATWLFILISAIVIGILMNFAYKLSNKTGENIWYYFLLSLRILSLGPTEKIPRKPHKILKPILFLWILACLILTTAYSAGFSSILTRPKLRNLKTIEDMANDNINWGSTSAFVKGDVISSIYRSAFQIAQNFQLESDRLVRNQRIRTNKYAIASDKFMDRYVTGTEYLDEYARTHLEALPQCYLKNAFVYPLSSNSPYKDLLNRRIFEISEYGFISFWTNRIIIKYNMFYMYRFFEKDNGIGDHVPLNVAKIQGVFYLLLTGYVVSFIVFLSELYCKTTYFFV